MSKPHPVIRQFYIIKMDDPQVQICQGGVREALEVNAACALQVFSGRFDDGAGELGAADSADAHCLEGDCAGYVRIAEELSAVSCGRITGDDKQVVLFIPGIEA